MGVFQGGRDPAGSSGEAQNQGTHAPLATHATHATLGAYPTYQTYPTHESGGWLKSLALAVNGRDEAAIEMLLAQSKSLPSAQDLVAQHIGRTPPNLEHRGAVQPFFGELWAIPVLVRDADPRAAEVFWLERKERIRNVLKDWAGQGVGVHLFGGLIPLDWVASWPIPVIRAHLDLLHARANTGVRFEVASINVPHGLPKLSFITLALRTSAPWPGDFVKPFPLECKGENAPGAHTINVTPSFAIQSCGAPSPLRWAIVDGLVRWVTELDECTGVEAWDITLDTTRHSMCALTVVLRSGDHITVTLNSQILGASATQCLMAGMAKICEYRLGSYQPGH